ncbi:hypothetical protein PMAYCL1PPCAC_16711 [Pristionchus mayeri]|uniref:Ent-6 n=1 Tax=Pristionchus mayeri TaxID=1317129 RepID=A0AAN5I043_9BILA|nr:hypothetical protein PMAYCL1PPCAC_16711 [Pristionchus mayeri]
MFRVRTVLAFIVVAMTSLIPYNLFLNAHQYFYYKLRNTTNIGGNDNLLDASNQTLIGTEPTTDLQRTYEGWFTVTSGVTCILGSLLNTLTTYSLSNGFRVLSGHAIVLLSLLPTIFYTFVDTDEHQVHFFWMSMFFSSISSFACCGLIGAGISGLAATYTKWHMQLVIVGSAVAGICTSLLSVACQAATSNSILNGRIYFGLAFVWTIFSLFCYHFLIEPDNVKRVDDGNQLLDEQEEEQESDDSQESAGVETEDHQGEISQSPLPSSSLFEGWAGIFQKSCADMTCAMLVIVVTCSAFPALASQVRTQTQNATWKAYFSSICCFFLYGCADLLGRVFASRISISRRQLQNVTLARMLLVPLIAVCDVQPRLHSPSLIRNDTVFVFLIMSLALSNGFCYSHAYVKAIQSVEPPLRETAGSMMSLVGNVVALLGAMIGVVIVAIM